MAKEAPRHDRKQEEQRDSTKPGTIVAGPDAHARERRGTAPTEPHDRQEDNPSTNPANR